VVSGPSGTSLVSSRERENWLSRGIFNNTGDRGGLTRNDLSREFLYWL
jgi:hypothetical protein